MARLDDVAVTPPPSRVLPDAARRRRLGLAALAAACYALLACLAYWPVGPLDARQLAGCACGDPEQQTWFLAWTSFALTHGLNPFSTGYLHVPAGANLAIDTSMPLLGLLGTPVTALAGPVATYNVLLRLALAANGMSMYLVLRRYTRWWPAAFGGGLLFAFSPYVVNQIHRHLFLVFLPLVPLFIPLLDDWLVSRRRTALRSGLLIGLAAGLQYLISPEIMLVCVMVAGVGLLFLALRYRTLVRERLGALGWGLAAAAPVFGLITGYPIWMLLAGPNRPTGPLHTLSDLSRYHGDLAATVLPTSTQLLVPGGLARAGNSLVGGRVIENGFYLGIPLLVLLGYLIVRCRRSLLVAVFVVVGAAAFVLSLGGQLTVDGKVALPWLPFALFARVPLLQDIEAARLSLFVQLAAAVVVGVGLDQLRASGWRLSGGQSAAGLARPVLVAAAGLVALLPLVPSLPLYSGNTNPPGFFTSQAVRVLPAGTVALTFPYDRAPHNSAMIWQAASGMRFRLIGGDVFVPLPDGSSTWRPDPPGPPVNSAILLAGDQVHPGPPPTSPQAVAALRQLCAQHRVGVVLVQRTAQYGRLVAGLFGRALRAPPLARGRMDVWLNVQQDLRRGAG